MPESGEIADSWIQGAWMDIGHTAEGGFYFHLNHRIMKKMTKEVSADAVSKMFRPDGNKPNQNTPCMGG